MYQKIRPTKTPTQRRTYRPKLTTIYQANSTDAILVSNENQQFRVKKDILRQSKVLEPMLDGNSEQSIPLPFVTSKALANIIAFCQYHHENGPMKAIEKPLTNTDLKEVVSEWDGAFIQSFSQEDLFELLLAANYIDLQPLLHLASAQVAALIKDKTPEEIQTFFDI